jgi:hypothetical protein
LKIQGPIAGFCRDGVFQQRQGIEPPSAPPEDPLAGYNQQQQRHTNMMLHDKMRQAGLIVIATTALLILPNLTSLIR